MSILADGEDAALRLIAEARAAAEGEARSQGESVRARIEAEAGQVRELAEAEVDAMTRRAQERLANAVAFLSAWVKAEAQDDGPAPGGSL